MSSLRIVYVLCSIEKFENYGIGLTMGEYSSVETYGYVGAFWKKHYLKM